MTFKLGVLATEYPPAAGGMEQQAAHLVSTAAASLAVTLVTWPDAAPQLGVDHVAKWSGEVSRDAALIAQLPVDAWLVLNAGWTSSVAAAAGLTPSFAYVHGNDFIAPWLPLPPRGILGVEKVEQAVHLPGGVSTYLLRHWRAGQAKHGLRKMRHIFANSRYTRERCRSFAGMDADTISVIAPGIGDRHFQPICQKPTNGRLELLTVARLSAANRRKNVDGLIEAMGLIEDRIAARLTIVGDGDDMPRLRALASLAGLGDRVHFAGRLDDAALERAYAVANLFVLVPRPDSHDVEGFGMVYAEAGARGVPSVATNVGGVADAVSDGINGLLIDDATAPTIAEAIGRFADQRVSFDPYRVQQFAEQFRASRTTAQLLGILQAKVADG